MHYPELLLIAIGLSMDAFAAAVCAGLSMRRATLGKSATVGFYFGLFQALMPLAGFLLAALFTDYILAVDHWIAFVLLCYLGGKMIAASFKRTGCADRVCPAITCADRECPKNKEVSLKFKDMLPMAVATSVDAFAVGISFAFLKVSIIPAVVTIGATTFVLSMIGVRVGAVFGTRFKSKAEFAGGVILILMGVKILLEHLGFINF